MSRDPRQPTGHPSRELETAPGVEPDGEMLRDLAEGIEPAAADFEDLVHRHGRRLYVLAYRLTGDRAEAEDLSQEALVRGYLALARFRGEADFYTYLYRTVLNLWKNQTRSRRRWRMVPLEGRSARGGEGNLDDPRGRSGPADRADPAPGPHEWLAGQEQAARIDRALAGIGPDFRAVLILRVAEGLEYGEIAEALGIRVGTVRSRLARARRRIRELLTT